MIQLYRRQRRRQALLRQYQAVLVASRHMLREYQRNGVVPNRLHLAPLFPPGVFPNREPPARRARTDCVVFSGRLTELKGGDYLIRALRLASRALGRRLRLTVAGDGPERGGLERLAKREGITAEFHGWVGKTRCTELLRDADLLAVPSVWPEPFGLIGLEAACVGVPAVGYSIGGIPEWLRPGVSGELASGNPPTVEGLAEAIVRVLVDDDRWFRLCQGAWRVATEFTLTSHLDTLEAVFTEMLSRRQTATCTEPFHSSRQ